MNRYKITQLMKNQFSQVRPIITGHDNDGKSIIVEDKPPPHTMCPPEVPAFGVTDFWNTNSSPASNAGSAGACDGPITLEPPSGGTVFRVVEFPPDRDYMGKWDSYAALVGMVDSGASALAASAPPHQAMHKTRSADYAFVLSGEIVAVSDTGEVAMQSGDVLVQRGTHHAWSNRTDTPAIVGFVLFDAEPI